MCKWFARMHSSVAWVACTFMPISQGLLRSRMAVDLQKPSASSMVQACTSMLRLRAAAFLLRILQAAMKAKGFPWTLAKSFQAACPLGPAFSTQGVDLGKLELGITVSLQYCCR
jgi:hypothetical protein